MALKKCLTVLSSSALFMFSATSKTKYSMEKHSGRVMTDEEPRPLSPDEKGQVLQLIKLIRDSPSEELFKENQEKLKAMTEGLTVRLGNSKNAVLFCSYYEANWESCAFRWVWAFRKNLPTKGTNDTQAAESTFRAIKHYAKVEFGAGGGVRGGREGEVRGEEDLSLWKRSLHM